MQDFVFDLQRFKVIENTKHEKYISGTSSADDVTNYGGNVTISTGNGDDSVSNIWDEDYDDDDNDISSADYASINTGAGNDSVYNWNGYWCTINTGEGNDLISLYSYSLYNVIIYNSGDGNDTIYGFDSDDTLSISGGSYSTTKSGKNIIVTVDDGKISLIGAAKLDEVNIDFTKTVETNKWTLHQTTATYGTSSKTLVTVKGVKSVDGLSVSNKVVTIKKASLGTSKVTISDGYTLKLGDDVKEPSTSNKWTISGSTAKYNQTTAAGYKLASDSKSISYSASSSKTLATVKGVKSVDGLSISGKVVTVKKASLGTSKVTINGTGYTLKLGSDVSASSTKKAAFSLSGSTATYKSSYKTAGYTLASDGKSISYTKATTAESLATIKGAASKTGLSVSGNTITLKKSALKSKVTVSGGYEFDFASDYKKATITGSSSGDTITARGSNLSINGGKGNDTIKALGTSTTLTGGVGSDVFIYKSGQSGVITDYAAEDKISISGGKVSTIKTSGSNVILTVGSGKITIKGGKDKTITYSDTSGKNKTYKYEETPVEDELVTLPKTYAQESYTMSDNVFTLDASAVRRDLNIVGNVFANSIIGSAQNDTLDGGKANDTLTGGAGSDIFLYKKDDGNDLITDYAEEDIVSITSDKVSNVKPSGSDVILTLASKGKITVAGGKDKVITYVDSGGEHMYPKMIIVNGKTITLTENYIKGTFDVTDYGDYKTINAAAVQRGLNIVGNELANSIFGTTDEDYIDGGTNNDTIRGGDGNDSLFGNAGKDKLYGGEGNDTLWGGKGNDWLDGGEGADIFIYNSNEGNDTIDGYDHDFDKIMVFSGTVENAAAVGSDVVFTMSTGEELTLLNAAGRNVKVFDGSNNKIKEYTART